MSDSIQTKGTEPADGGPAGETVTVRKTPSDAGNTSPAIHTYDRPATAGRPRLNPLVIILLVIILALLSYAAFQLIR